MKKINILLLASAFFLSGHIFAQSCKADFDVNIPQCFNISFSSLSSGGSGFKTYWTFDGVKDTNKRVNLSQLDYDSLTVCVYVEDSAGNCFDTLCRTYKGFKYFVPKYNYFIYKDRIFIYNTNNEIYSKSSKFICDFGDNTTQVGSLGIFQHLYKNPGNYTIRVTIFDSVPNANKFCPIQTEFDVAVGNNIKCQAFFYAKKFDDIPDSVFLVNWSAGENLTYEWDFGDGTFSTKRFPSHQYSMSKKVKVCLKITDPVSGCSSLYCDSIILDKNNMTISIVGNIEKQELSINRAQKPFDLVMPNPFNNEIEIKLDNSLDNVNWEIYNVTGVKVLSGVLENSNRKLNLESLNNGMYLLLLHTKNQSYSQKIIKTY